MAWWIWLLLGLVLLVLELVSTGFFIMFFGIGALVVGLVGLAGVHMPPWAQWLLFPVVSVASLMLFRERLQARLQTPHRKVDNIVGESAVATADITAGAMGQVEMRGAVWNAKNDGMEAIAGGQRCRVVLVEGLTLHVVNEAQSS